MKKTIFAVLIVLALCFFYFGAKLFFVGKFMNTDQVCQTWGDAPFSVAQFNAANGKKDEESARAKMACSLIRSQNVYMGKNPKDIIDLLGPPTGYYNNDSVPAYVIGPEKNSKKNIWQIVFLLDQKGKVSTAALHQHCCYQKESWAFRFFLFALDKITATLLWLGLP